tara:strand:- start:1642 stop:1956 length:315 start_codon:yes stop_codon:yes gene_type:complete
MSYWSDNAGWRTGSAHQVEKLGHPGKYTQTTRFSGGQLDLTGSNLGYGALVVKTHSGATASLLGGGDIRMGELTAGTVYDLSLGQLSGSAGTSVVYIFKTGTRR